jgi:hypothetical protein
MQLDNTRVAIRERDFLELLDLSLQVIRSFALPWFVITLLTAAPLAVFNAWVLQEPPARGGNYYSSQTIVGETLDPDRRNRTDARMVYALRMLALVLFEAPLAAAPLTLYLGSAVFQDRPTARKIVRDLAGSLPQLLLFQVFIRALIFLPALLGDAGWLVVAIWFLPFTWWPYLNEVILLERNPLFLRRGRITTWQRSKSLHANDFWANAGKWFMSTFLATGMTAGLTLTVWYFWTLVTHHRDRNQTLFVYCLPVGVWLVASFFTVARYLCYLDLRIRREGWEVELQLRAEAEHLARQIA